jgi:hypothetical protein
LEEAICLKADAQFRVVLREWNSFPTPEAQSIEYEENINGDYSPIFRFDKSEAITFKYYVLPLIEKFIQIESELRAFYKIPMSLERLKYLREYLKSIVRSMWDTVLTKALRDSREHVICKLGELPEYKEEELYEHFFSELKRDPVASDRNFSSVIEDLLQIAYADSIIYSQTQTGESITEADNQVGHSVVINSPQNLNLNIATTLSNAKQSINGFQTINQMENNGLEELIVQLLQELKKAPNEKAKEAEVVAEYAKELVDEVSKEAPKQSRINVSKEGLIKAAENIANVLPMVLQIAKQIGNHMLVSG